MNHFETEAPQPCLRQSRIQLHQHSAANYQMRLTVQKEEPKKKQYQRKPEALGFES